MIVIGLTGSIGMGKTETAKLFAAEGIPVSDADTIVHQLYQPDGAAAAAIGKAFPGTLSPSGVDRPKLTAWLAAHPQDFATLEAIVHPLVRQAQQTFVNAKRAEGCAAVVLDIPLLFETGRARDVELTLTVSAPAAVQRQRVMTRPGMTEAKFNAILSRQMPDAEKRRRADAVLDSSKGLVAAALEVKHIVTHIKAGKIHARNHS